MQALELAHLLQQDATASGMLERIIIITEAIAAILIASKTQVRALGVFGCLGGFFLAAAPVFTPDIFVSPRAAAKSRRAATGRDTR